MKKQAYLKFTYISILKRPQHFQKNYPFWIISVQKWSKRDTNYSYFRCIFKMGNAVWFFLQKKLLENPIIKLAWKMCHLTDHSTLHNSQRRKELQFSQTQLSGRSWRNTRYYIFWTSRTFVKPLRTHLPSIFSLKFCHQGALIIVSLLEKSINVESVENCDHRCYSYLKNKVKLFS